MILPWKLGTILNSNTYLILAGVWEVAIILNSFESSVAYSDSTSPASKSELSCASSGVTLTFGVFSNMFKGIVLSTISNL